METLRNLPDIAGRRFGNLALGYDRIEQIRAEVSVLETLAALVCGCPREDLTVERVQKMTADLRQRAAALTDDDYAEWRDEDPLRLIAIAVGKPI
jgi:hypothetical protein